MSIGSYAADLSSPSIDSIDREFDARSINESTGSTISPLDDEQLWTTSRDYAKEPMARDGTVDDDGNVSVSAGWTLQLAETVSQTEDQLEALFVAAEAGRKKAKAEDDLVNAQLKAEFEAKRLRERLEEIIKEKLTLELSLESTQEDLKDKEKYYAREKRELQVRVDAELEAIRTERRALLIRVDTLEEENDCLCIKLLAGKDKKPDIFVAIARELKRFGKKWKSFHPWSRKPSRGSQL